MRAKGLKVEGSGRGGEFGSRMDGWGSWTSVSLASARHQRSRQTASIGADECSKRRARKYRTCTYGMDTMDTDGDKRAIDEPGLRAQYPDLQEHYSPNPGITRHQGTGVQQLEQQSTRSTYSRISTTVAIRCSSASPGFSASSAPPGGEASEGDTGCARERSSTCVCC